MILNVFKSLRLYHIMHDGDLVDTVVAIPAPLWVVTSVAIDLGAVAILIVCHIMQVVVDHTL